MKGVTFGNYHSYNDLSMVLSSKTIGTPEAKTATVSIPGADGVLDVTEYFGDIKYDNRQLTFVFALVIDPDNFLTQLTTINNALNGQKVRIILDDDPNFYYSGRLSVSDFTVSNAVGNVTVTADCNPYKYKLNETTVSKTVSSSATVTLTNSRMRVTPTITTTAAVTLTFNGNTYSLSAGTFTVPEIVLESGSNSITISGKATVTFKYQEGEL